MLEGSLRKSILKHGYCVNRDTLRVGLTVAGYVFGYTKNSAIVAISGCKERGVLCPNELCENRGLVLQKELPLGRQF